MIVSTTTLVLLGALMALWTAAALWAWFNGRAMQRQAEAARRLSRRLSRMTDESPAIPLLVRTDGRIEGPDRLAGWLGLDAVPEYLSELDAEPAGIPAEQLAELTAGIRATQKTAAPFQMAVTPRGSERSLLLRTHLADPQVSPGGAALVWWFDFSESEAELKRLRAETHVARQKFDALCGLIEAAPMPMWFRAPDMQLLLVNDAYVRAVDGAGAEAVVAAGTELIEPHDGLSAAQVAQQARDQGMAFTRIVPATIDGQRQTLRVTDLPLGDDGVAGYAVNIEEMEELQRSFRGYREAQRATLDTLSAAVAQFDESRGLVFSNQPFQRIFALQYSWLLDNPQFDRLLDRMREMGRLPEVRDFPEWRKERHRWFTAAEASEEAWLLSDGTHLRVVAQPLPDGGLLLICEDRTEQLQLASARDTLLRTRTATFDNLFESLAVFAPDGRLNLWNRRFVSDWVLDEAFINQHPRVDVLLSKMAPQLKRPAHIAQVREVILAATMQREQRSGRLELKDGRTFEFAGVPLPDGNGLLAVLDVSDSQRIEQALRDRNEALIEADGVKSRFIANMSYEFRTPLTSIGGFAELLASGLAGPITDQAQEYVHAILASVSKLTDQIETVLDLSQSEAGTLPLAQENVALFPLLEQLVKDRAKAITEAGVAFELRGEASPNAAGGNVTGDPRRLAQAFGKVIDNALRYTPAGGRVLVLLDKVKKGAHIIVSDNGPGMDSKALARALEGIQVTEDGIAMEKRQGLGLPLARQLVCAHGGSFAIESEPGEGTIVTMTLP